MYRYVYLSVCCMLYSGMGAWAQKSKNCSLELQGVLRDASSGETLTGASVYLQERRWHVVCDDNGTFVFRGLCSGTYTLSIFHVGYINKDTSVFLDHQIPSLKLHLQRDTSQRAELVVTGERSDTAVSKAARSILTGVELDLAKTTSLGEGLKALPGVYAQQSGVNTYKPMIQGMSGNRILIFNNGVRQEGQQWGTDHAPEIDPLIADEIQVIKGAESVRYGSDALGGVILVNPAPLIDKGLSAEVYLSGNSVNRGGVASARVDYAPSFVRQLSLRLQGSLKQGGNYKTPRYYLNNTGIREYNFSWALRKTIGRITADVYYSQFNTQTGIYAGSHIGNLTDLQRALSADEPLTPQSFSYEIGKPYQHIEHELVKASVSYKLNKGQSLSLEGTRQYNYRAEYDNHRSQNNGPGLEFKITTHTGTLNYKHRISARLKGDVGLNALYQENTVGGRIFIPNFINSTVGAYWIEKLRSGRWTWEAGVRYDVRNLTAYFNRSSVISDTSYQYHNYSFSLGGTLALKGESHWSFLLSRAFRSPAVNELFSKGLHHGVAALENGNTRLVPEVAYNVSTAYHWHHAQWEAELNLYVNYIQDYIYLQPSEQLELTIYGAFPSFRYEQTNALLMGGDASVSYLMNEKYRIACRFSTLSGQDMNSGGPIIYMPPTRLEPSIGYRFGNTGRLKNATISINSLVMFRKENAPVDRDYAPAPAGYVLFGLEGSSQLSMGTQYLTAGFRVNNLFNTVYRDYLDRFRYYHDAPGIGVQLFVKVPLTIIH